MRVLFFSAIRLIKFKHGFFFNLVVFVLSEHGVLVYLDLFIKSYQYERCISGITVTVQPICMAKPKSLDGFGFCAFGNRCRGVSAELGVSIIVGTGDTDLEIDIGISTSTFDGSSYRYAVAGFRAT